MRIEHFAIYTTDLERLRQFYMTYFNAGCNQGYYNDKTGLRTYFLTFDCGSRLEIMSRPEVLVQNNKTKYMTGYTHLAFSVGSRENVDRLTHDLENAGYVITDRPRTTGDGYYESVILDPDGNFIEITA